MSVTDKPPGPNRSVARVLRRMEQRDVPQVKAIEREAFPTIWPPPPFHKELRSSFIRHLVAQGPPANDVDAPVPPAEPPPPPPPRTRLGRLLRGLLRLLGGDAAGDTGPPPDPILGYVSVWVMGSDAHIAGIAVREEHRGWGIGELLLIGAVETGLRQGLETVTLEVRVSNAAAQALYVKHGFREVGLRKGYYRDNKEDALIMTTEPIASVEFQEAFRRRIADHEARWGRIARAVG